MEFLALIGNFSPIFIMTYIVYIGYSLSIWLVPVILTLFCNLIWIKIFSKKELMGKPNSSEESYNISEVREIDFNIVAYYISYTISFIAILFLPYSKGIFILGAMLILFYILINSNKIMLFNPFLALFGYIMFEVRTKNGTTFYILSKEQLEKGSVTIYKIDPYIYYYESIPDIG